MKVIYHAENTIDANLLKGLLAQEGIVAFVNGSYLQGAVGELPASGLITVSVADDDATTAMSISKQFQLNLSAGHYALDENDDPGNDWVQA